MIRWAGIVGVVLGLIVQPLMAVMPVEIDNQITNTTEALTIDMSAHVDGYEHHGPQNINKIASAPCHEKVADHESSSGTCDHCDTNCISGGICASSCLGGAAASREVMVLPEQRITTPIFGNAEHLGSGFLSRIYHPPKHS